MTLHTMLMGGNRPMPLAAKLLPFMKGDAFF
jgi:hypothetical protein